MHFTDTINGMQGVIHLEIRKNGKLIETEDDHNLIVITGRGALAKLLGGGRTGGITKIGVGTGSAATADGDTNLTNRVLIPVQSAEYTETSVKFNFVITTAQANGTAICEFGLFFADNVMFSRRVRKSVITKEDDITVSGYWKIYL